MTRPTFHRCIPGSVIVRDNGGEEIGMITNLISAWRYDGVYGPLARTYLRDLKADLVMEVEIRENCA